MTILHDPAQPIDLAHVAEQLRARLALAFIVKNEGRYALDMLASVIGGVGFVACVDTGSTDDTVERIEAYLVASAVPYAIERRAFTRFDEMRNAAIDLVPDRFPWTLMLDADEVMVEKDAPELLALIDQDVHDAWFLPRFNWIDRMWGDKTEQYPDPQGRLFRSGPDAPIRYAGTVHETLSFARSLGMVEPGPGGPEGVSDRIHIHHIKLFQKGHDELERREDLYRMLQTMPHDTQATPQTRRPELIQAIWAGHDPFAGVARDPRFEDYQGWRSVHPYLSESIDEMRPDIVVEVGVWKGGSTMFMAEHMKARGIPGCIVAVDTWLGASDHWLQPEWFSSLHIDRGYPTLFRTFMANVVGKDLQDMVLPLPLDSANAAHVLRARGIQPKVVHIDAGHDYHSVMNDLNAWWPAVAPGGILIGDDYEPGTQTWPEVVKAFQDFFRTDQIEHSSGKCRIRKT